MWEPFVIMNVRMFREPDWKVRPEGDVGMIRISSIMNVSDCGIGCLKACDSTRRNCSPLVEWWMRRSVRWSDEGPKNLRVKLLALLFHGVRSLWTSMSENSIVVLRVLSNRDWFCPPGCPSVLVIVPL